MDSHIIVSNNEAIILTEEGFQDVEMSNGYFFETGMEANRHQRIGEECPCCGPREPENAPALPHQYFANRQQRTGQEGNGYPPRELENDPLVPHPYIVNRPQNIDQNRYCCPPREPEYDPVAPHQYFANRYQMIGQECPGCRPREPEVFPASPHQYFDNRRHWPNQVQHETLNLAVSTDLMAHPLPPPPPLIPITFVPLQYSHANPQQTPADHPVSIPQRALGRRNRSISSMLTSLFRKIEEFKATLSQYFRLFRAEQEQLNEEQ